MTDQNNRQTFEPGDVVKYTRKFWELANQHIPSYPMSDIVDNPMIILKCTTVITRAACESDKTDKDEVDYFMYDVIQGDKQFEISDAWVELVK